MVHDRREAATGPGNQPWGGASATPVIWHTPWAGPRRVEETGPNKEFVMRSIEHCLVALVAAAGALTAQGRWGEKAFSVDPLEVYRAAAAAKAPEGVPVIVLLEESRWQFDEAGRSTRTYRRIYRVVNRESGPRWASLAVPWDPWHEQQAEMQARVIQPDGKVAWLDPKTIEGAVARAADPDLYSDRRLLRAPLPAVRPEVVVETQVLRRETTPSFDRGLVYRFLFGDDVPVEETRLVIEAPAGLPLRHKTVLLEGVRFKQEQTGGRVRLLFEHGPMAAVAPPASRTSPAKRRRGRTSPSARASPGTRWRRVTARWSMNNLAKRRSCARW